MRPRLLATLAAAALLAACTGTPTREHYVVMPEGGGRSGTVDVIPKGRPLVTLHGEYSALEIDRGRPRTYQASADDVRKAFGPALAALPEPPATGLLFFLTGKDELTAESKATAQNLYAEFVARHAPEVWIIGYTDTVGSDRVNDALSLKRAERVRQTLVRLGVPSDHIYAKGMGKRSLLVPTPDNTSEQRNRRVEISVR